MNKILALILSILISFGNVCNIDIPTTENPEEFLLCGFTLEDIYEMANTTMIEAGGESYEGKQAVVATLINRYNSTKYPNTIPEIITDGYSTKRAAVITQECYDAVLWGILHQDIFPEDMYWFRNNHYHAEVEGKRYNYIQIGNHYFSTERNYGDEE